MGWGWIAERGWVAGGMDCGRNGLREGGRAEKGGEGKTKELIKQKLCPSGGLFQGKTLGDI